MLSASNYSIFDVIYLPPINSAHFLLKKLEVQWQTNGDSWSNAVSQKDLYTLCKIHIIRISILYSVNIIVLEPVSYSHSLDRSEQHLDISCSFCIRKSIGL